MDLYVDSQTFLAFRWTTWLYYIIRCNLAWVVDSGTTLSSIIIRTWSDMKKAWIFLWPKFEFLEIFKKVLDSQYTEVFGGKWMIFKSWKKSKKKTADWELSEWQMKYFHNSHATSTTSHGKYQRKSQNLFFTQQSMDKQTDSVAIHSIQGYSSTVF